MYNLSLIIIYVITIALQLLFTKIETFEKLYIYLIFVIIVNIIIEKKYILPLSIGGFIFLSLFRGFGLTLELSFFLIGVIVSNFIVRDLKNAEIGSKWLKGFVILLIFILLEFSFSEFLVINISNIKIGDFLRVLIINGLIYSFFIILLARKKNRSIFHIK